ICRFYQAEITRAGSRCPSRADAARREPTARLISPSTSPPPMLLVRRRGPSCALALLAFTSPLAISLVRADDITLPPPPTIAAPTETTAPTFDVAARPPDPAAAPMPDVAAAAIPPDPAAAAPSEENVPFPDVEPSKDHVIRLDQPATGEPPCNDADDNGWVWQWVPTGIIYHSYMAGPQEPRSSIFVFTDLNGDTFGDAALGGRMGFLKYGNTDPTHPEGWQLDFYGACLPRLNLDHQEDLESCDYVFGLPLTYGNEVWQTKFGYAH